MKYRPYLFVLCIVFAGAQSNAQSLPRTFGARAFSMDDGTGSGNTLTLDLNSPLTTSYQLHLPPSPPPSPYGFLSVDPTGTASWMTSTLPPLPFGNIWCGNILGQADPMPPGTLGAILVIGTTEYGVPAPEWAMTIPSNVTMSANQITSGTIQPGVVITVGDGASIGTGGSGSVTANHLSGAGPGKYSAAIPIPQDAPSMDIFYSGITAASIVVVSISDPNAANFTVIASVTAITPGVGFSVTFTAPYPNPAGSLNYTVVNP